GPRRGPATAPRGTAGGCRPASAAARHRSGRTGPPRPPVRRPWPGRADRPAGRSRTRRRPPKPRGPTPDPGRDGGEEALGIPLLRRLGADPAVQLVELDRLGRGRELVQLEAVEVLGAAAGPLEDAVDGAGVDVADVGGRLDRAAVPQA